MTPKVGDVVFIKPLMISGRRTELVTLNKATVEKVGRKWFTVKEHPWSRFSIDDGIVDGKGFTPSMKAYASIAEEQNERIAKAKREKVFSFKYSTLTDSEIDEVLAMIERAEQRKLEATK